MYISYTLFYLIYISFTLQLLTIFHIPTSNKVNPYCCITFQLQSDHIKLQHSLLSHSIRTVYLYRTSRTLAQLLYSIDHIAQVLELLSLIIRVFARSIIYHRSTVFYISYIITQFFTLVLVTQFLYISYIVAQFLYISYIVPPSTFTSVIFRVAIANILQLHIITLICFLVK